MGFFAGWIALDVVVGALTGVFFAADVTGTFFVPMG